MHAELVLDKLLLQCVHLNLPLTRSHRNSLFGDTLADEANGPIRRIFLVSAFGFVLERRLRLARRLAETHSLCLIA